MNNHTLMKFCPATGALGPYPSHAGQWRQWHGKIAWLYNPFTGAQRSAAAVGTDPFGILIVGHDVLTNYIDVEETNNDN